LKSGSLNLLEPYGPVQACNGIALPLPLCVSIQDGAKVTRQYRKLVISVTSGFCATLYAKVSPHLFIYI
jgi:hypothetical protein